MAFQKNLKNKTLIEVRGVNINFGTFEALKDISFSIEKGERIGLVGANGAGKSTLLKALTGKIPVDIGNIVIHPQVNVGYLPQITIGDTRSNDQKSGGEKTKLILSKLFSAQHDIYLLDEPTNNLDVEGLTWLEKEIHNPSNESSAFVIVSHDRDFLDRTVNKIIEVDELTRSIRQFKCSFSEYRDIKKKEQEDHWKKYEETVDEKKRLKKSTNQRQEWIKDIERKRINNRKLDAGEKEKPRAAYLRDKEGAMGQRAKAVQKRMNKISENLNDLEKPERKLPINLEFENTERSGEVVFRLDDIVYIYGQNISKIGPINLEIKNAQRVHIVGKNGAGKTTLIKILLNEINPTSGSFTLGSRVQVGYLPQEDILKPDENIIDVMCDVLNITRNDEEEGLLRRTLKRFGFEEEDSKKNVGQLSSGERSRLQLAMMKLMKPNCIILDEPSNHLDIEGVEALEKALKHFKGTLIIVSHDKRFIKEIGLDIEFSI